MKVRGRVNWIILSVLVLTALIVFLAFFGGEAPSTAANRFLLALGKGDVETLTEMSYFKPERPREQVEADWKKTLSYSRHFLFMWRVKSDRRPTPDRAIVALLFVKDARRSGSYEENFILDLVKVDGKWKVDVQSINREMFPALPR
jgi:hypothetical protein